MAKEKVNYQEVCDLYLLRSEPRIFASSVRMME